MSAWMSSSQCHDMVSCPVYHTLHLPEGIQAHAATGYAKCLDIVSCPVYHKLHLLEGIQAHAAAGAAYDTTCMLGLPLCLE